MIDKGISIHKKSVNRIAQLNEDGKQVNFQDQRFYKKGDNHYPSVTTILQCYPKGKYFENWLKDVGWTADIIAKKSADEGTQVHTAIEKYLEGEKIIWIDDKGISLYSLDVWKMVLKFHEFWTNYKPELLGSEIHLISDKYKIAGTTDLVVRINGEIWLLDLKTSKQIHTTHDLQISAYAKCWNETFEEKIQRVGIIWLKSSKHGIDKSGTKIQGKGWELYEPERSIDENFEIFNKVYDIFRIENPTFKPYSESYPVQVQLNPDIYK
jgi:hypothetical protein